MPKTKDKDERKPKNEKKQAWAYAQHKAFELKRKGEISKGERLHKKSGKMLAKSKAAYD